MNLALRLTSITKYDPTIKSKPLRIAKAGRAGHKRRGISSVISTTILMGIAVTLGLVLWTNVNSQVATSTQSMAAATTDYVNYVNDRFTVINAAFAHDANGLCPSDNKCVTIWVYNYGERPLQIDSMYLAKSGDPMDLSNFKMPSGTDSIPVNTAAAISIKYDTGSVFSHDGSAYDFKVITSGGASHNYYQTDE